MQSLAVVFMVTGLAVSGPFLQLYEAVIRLPNGATTHVTIEAKDYFEAKDQIPMRYCGGEECIVQGPWQRHDHTGPVIERPKF